MEPPDVQVCMEVQTFPRSDVCYHIYDGTPVEIAAYVLRYICDRLVGDQDHDEHTMDVKPKSQLVWHLYHTNAIHHDS